MISFAACPASPQWLTPAVNRLDALTRLPAGWDGHGGRPVSPSVARFTVDVLKQVMPPDTPPPQIVPLSYGGVQLEWHRNGWDVEIEIGGPGDVSLYLHDVSTGLGHEETLGSDLGPLSGVIQLLTSGN